jgi:hypothetical protein
MEYDAERRGKLKLHVEVVKPFAACSGELLAFSVSLALNIDKNR